MRKLFYSLLVLSVCSVFSYSEIFYLKSGKVIDGKILSETDDSVTVALAGTGIKRKIMLYEIEEVTKTPRATPSVSQARSAAAVTPEDARTQFTSGLKQENAEGDIYVKDNASGVLVFNVQETVVEKPKASAKPADEDGEFDAALFLLGGSSDNSAAQKPEASRSESQASSIASDEQPKKEIESGQSEDYSYDASMFLVDDQPVPLSKSDKKDAEESAAAEKITSDKPESETFLAIALDLKGSHVFSGEVNNSGIDKTEKADYGISLSAEQYGYVSRFAAIGLGIGFQFKRCLEESPGRFGFLPLYGAFKMRFISEEDYHFYAVAHLGYNFLLANSAYLDNKSDAGGGLYYAGGLGASYNRYVFQVLYSVNNGSVKYSSPYAVARVDKDVKYSKVGFYVGYLL
ncbi:MAG: hypothetical protein FWG57_01815 [Endomicrobia bacterium]|nr:hypothetical protein [Endomicrobiia bacterium]